MAQYPIKLLKDETGTPFVPLTSLNAVTGEEYILSTFLAEKVLNGHYKIINDKLQEKDILNRIITVKFPKIEDTTAISYLRLNEEAEYPIYDAEGQNGVLLTDLSNTTTFLTLTDGMYRMIKVSATGASSGGGHVIVTESGDLLPQRPTLTFKGINASDDSSMGTTVISAPSLVNNLTTTESGLGGLDAYQGKILNDNIQERLPLSGGEITGDLKVDKYLKLKSWPGYGNGESLLWYDGNNQVLDIDNVKEIHINDNYIYHQGRKPTPSEIGALSTGGGNLTGTLTSDSMLKTTNIIFGYRYNTNNNAPAFVLDKPGSHYAGIGANGGDTIRFGPVTADGNYNWVDGYNSQKWYFNGSIYTSDKIAFRGNHSDTDMISFKNGNADGNGIVIGGGGYTGIGSGESAQTVWSGVSDQGDTENIRISGDDAIYFHPGQQSGFTNSTAMVIHSNGNITKKNGQNIPAVYIGSAPSNPQVGDILVS